MRSYGRGELGSRQIFDAENEALVFPGREKWDEMIEGTMHPIYLLELEFVRELLNLG